MCVCIYIYTYINICLFIDFLYKIDMAALYSPSGDLTVALRVAIQGQKLPGPRLQQQQDRDRPGVPLSSFLFVIFLCCLLKKGGFGASRVWGGRRAMS